MTRRGSKSFHGLSGEGRFNEATYFKTVHVYERVRVQKWSPFMSEAEIERGVRIGRFRLGFTTSALKFIIDGKTKIERRRYGL